MLGRSLRAARIGVIREKTPRPATAARARRPRIAGRRLLVPDPGLAVRMVASKSRDSQILSWGRLAEIHPRVL